MERRFIKSALYGFVLGLALSILFIDYKEVTNLGNGAYATTYKPVTEYIVSILRFSIVGMFLGLFVGWIGYRKKQQAEQSKTYYFPFFLVVFAFSIFIMFALNW